jgi:adenine deaminase
MSAEPVHPELRRRAVAAAAGEAPFDLLLTGGVIVDVGTGEQRPADVGIVGPLVASVHPPGSRIDAQATYELDGRWLAPGLIDMHVHFESSMLTPGAYASAVCPRGTTTVFCDPHELANVAGVPGVRYAADASRGLPVRFVIQAPSCVPPIPGIEVSGAELHGAEVRDMLGWSEVGGLAEVMDTAGVLGRSQRMVDVVEAGLDAGKLVCGHAAGLTGPSLQAYICAGITSDHEMFSDADVAERLRAGMTVELRGALGWVLPGVVAHLASLPELPTHLVACTDDLLALMLLTEGGIDHLLRRLVAAGLPPVRALRLATYHAAHRLRRTDLGLIAPGRRADLVALSSLEDVLVDDVWTDGCHVASGGDMLVPCADAPAHPPLDTMRLGTMLADDFVLRLPGLVDGKRRLRVIDGIAMTSWGEVEVDVRDGSVIVPPGLVLQVVIHRHGRMAPVPRIALVRGWSQPGGDWTGAVATTVSHDTHNLVVFGREGRDMAAAANAVISDGGGVAVASDGAVRASLALPIAGILSPRPAAEVAAAQRGLEQVALSIGLTRGLLTQPLFQLFLATLACMPGPHVTDQGLVDGQTGELVNDLVLGQDDVSYCGSRA